MRKFILVLTMFIVVMLTACSSPEDKFTSEVTDFNDSTLVDLSEIINQLNTYEEESSKLVSDALTDEDLVAFKEEGSELYKLLDKRQEEVDQLSDVRERIDKHKENISNIDINEAESISESDVEGLTDSLSTLSEQTKGLEDNYNNLLENERSYFKSLGEEDADYTLMTEGMTKVNDTYSKVQSNYQDLNKQLGSMSANKETENDTVEGASKEDSLYQVDPETSAIIPLDQETEEKVVLLTIDDAPDGYALEMAHTLKDLDAPAIFFVNGMFLESEEGKAALKEIHDLGFAIGNHTYNHFNLDELTPEDVKLEIVDTSNLIEEVIGEKPKFFRAPFGVNNETSFAVAEELGMTVMNWTYGYDWEEEYQDAASLSQIMTETEMLQNGANLLMHDRMWSSEALSDIVTGLKDQGYGLVDPATIEENGGVSQ